jgi:uncharacterized protein DUF4157
MRSFAQKQDQPQKQVSSSPARSNEATSGKLFSISRSQRASEDQTAQQSLPDKPDCLEARFSAGEATRFAQDFSQIQIHPKSRASSRENPAISSPGDACEQEADRISEQVMRMPEPQLQAREPERDRHQTKRLYHEQEPLQVKRTESSDLKQTPATAVVHDVLAASGQPLDSAAREFMEPRFGYDFSRVRVHTDAKAARSAESINALAYTVGRHIVFGEGRYAPASSAGQRLLAHELAHVLQPAANTRIARDPDDEEKAPVDAGPKSDAPSSSGEQQADAGVDAAPAPTPAPQPAANPTETPGGHTPAPLGMAACPDAPQRNLIVVGCNIAPSPTPPAAEKAALPPPPTGRFGGDAERAKFAKELAQCRAEREVKEEIEKRFQSDVSAAKKRATEESKADTEAAIKAATEGLDPKDKGAINRAKTQATTDAKKAAAKKIADAQAAITRQDVAAVTTELATKYENNLATDFDNTMKGALDLFGQGWTQSMQTKLNSERKRITKEKSAKPKVAKGETPPPAKSADQIAAEVEADMTQVRCDQKEWVLNRLEGISRAWAVGRREEVDFRTIPQKAAFLKDFKPTYEVAAADRKDIPANLQPDEKARHGVAPELADFLSQLAADSATPGFTASNRPGHGGGGWAGKGFSTDIFLNTPQDQRGFWQHSIAVKFLLAVDAKAKALGARWRVLHDDFGVAQEVNQITGSRNVEFMGDSGGSRLNWHGPDPLILHFHLDLEIPQKKPAPAAGTQP